MSKSASDPSFAKGVEELQIWKLAKKLKSTRGRHVPAILHISALHFKRLLRRLP